ncbi:MAG: DDE-type integrase/transposase/recombinase [Rhodocyclales bacterium]|nr:DDE-type integrase/transposase/recombinase [Rhodocyclales bacterium]
MSVVRSTLTPGGFINLAQGAYASYGGRTCKIRRVISLDCVVIQYVDGDETERVHPTELRPVVEAPTDKGSSSEASDEGKAAAKTTSASNQTNLDEISDPDWKQAKANLEIIKPLLENPKRTRADVEAVAKANSVNASTIYKWISSYSSTGHVSGLVSAKRGRKKGTKLLSPEQEAVIEEEIEKYLDPQAITPATLIDDLETRFDELGLPRPHPNTIRNRIADIPLKRRISSRGNTELSQQRFDPAPGKFPDGKHPLDCVQIDHVQLDIKVVDSDTRQTIEKRPWLTLVIDCYSRMIVGYFLSLMHPSAFGAGVALYMGMMPKRDLLAELGLPGRWPVFGKIRKIFADNAKEFKGSVLQRACEEHQIDLQLRPVKTPKYGAYIESMVGNVNKQLHKKPGTVHRSPNVSPDYDSSAEAAYTLATLECEIVDWIVNRYHVSVHSSLNTTPLKKWERGLLGDSKAAGIGLPPIPANPEKLRLDFLPFEKRAVHPYGVEIDRFYYHEVLNRWIGEPDPDDSGKKRKFIFHYDPRSIRLIWFWDPEVKRHFEIPLRDPNWPDISWEEYREYVRTMKQEGASHVDEAAIKGYVQRSKLRTQTEVEKTQQAKGRGKRSAPKDAHKDPKNTAPGAERYAATSAASSKNPKAEGDAQGGDADNIFNKPAAPFEDIDI